MTNDTLQRTLLWFEKAIPKPTEQNIHVQFGVHFEEVSEMLVELHGRDHETTQLIDQALVAMQALANHLKTHTDVITVLPLDREKMLDSICDQMVTGTGLGHVLGYDILGAMHEVNDSNFSKFDDNEEPIFNENMKISKGPNYRAVNLKPFV